MLGLEEVWDQNALDAKTKVAVQPPLKGQS